MPEHRDEVSPVETLWEAEALYRRVLELTRRQEGCLRSGDVGALPQILRDKMKALTAAQSLTVVVRDDPAADRGAPELQAVLGRVAALLSETLDAEDRCRTLAPPVAPDSPRRQVVAAYSMGTHRSPALPR